ncbi:hypothetical protein LTR28_008389, partial [Elasticomyces elasticus]
CCRPCLGCYGGALATQCRRGSPETGTGAAVGEGRCERQSLGQRRQKCNAADCSGRVDQEVGKTLRSR